MRVPALAALATALVILGCKPTPQNTNAATQGHDLVGAWRSKVQFQGGAFAPVKDLEFMYVFNSGGTMTESSNYDAYPPVPPAYGVWRRVNGNQFEAHYEFYTTRPPEAKDSAAAGTGWLPAGRGVLTERIMLSDDGKTFTSEIQLQMLDQAGAAVEGGGTATGAGMGLGL